MGQVAGHDFAPEQSFLPLTAPGDAVSVLAVSHVAALFSLQQAFAVAHEVEQDLPLTAPGAAVLFSPEQAPSVRTRAIPRVDAKIFIVGSKRWVGKNERGQSLRVVDHHP